MAKGGSGGRGARPLSHGLGRWRSDRLQGSVRCCYSDLSRARGPQGQDAYLLRPLLCGIVRFFRSPAVLGFRFLQQDGHGFEGRVLLGHLLAAGFSRGELSATNDDLEFES